MHRESDMNDAKIGRIRAGVDGGKLQEREWRYDSTTC